MGCTVGALSKPYSHHRGRHTVEGAAHPRVGRREEKGSPGVLPSRTQRMCGAGLGHCEVKLG